ncbi:transcriptional repressor NrdR [bacterium]|nr:transcriptional repressor NrdR [bacterium]HPF35270.1 transcriptional regulator NrdR [Candidatus Krumholzibacteria bacterium]HRX51095.1 transcriptional regulator NrdR [Candidatus Krumholzibacteria bacterium]
MRCPRCDAEDDRVVDSRAARDGRAVRRRRECLQCGERFTTFEAVEQHPLLVVKRDGERVAFDRAKIVRGIARACEKRPVALAQMEALAERVERALESDAAREVPSQAVGELVMRELRGLDEVAYVRFASVYRSFRDVDEFMLELRTLLDGKEDARDGQ